MPDKHKMRLAFGQIRSVDPETMINARQLGIDRVHFNLPFDLPADRFWKYEDLLDFRERAESYGVTVEGMENFPIRFYDKAMLGEPGRDEQIDNICQSVRNAGRAGIRVIGYHFSPSFVWRTSNRAPLGRYGALVQAFDLSQQQLGVDDMDDFGQRRDVLIPDVELLWDNYAYFMRRVLPVAQEYGVTLALHPDDPPIPSLSGIARMFVDVDSFRRADAMFPSKNWGVLFCIGSFSQMTGGAKNVFEAIDAFGSRGKLVYAHMRDVQGTVPCFHECLLGEGNFDPYEVMLALYQSGFNGFILSDHVPAIQGDTPWGHRARINDTAYLRGLMEAIEKTQGREKAHGENT